MLDRNPVLWLAVSRGAHWVGAAVFAALLSVGIGAGYLLDQQGMINNLAQVLWPIAWCGWISIVSIKMFAVVYISRSLAAEKQDGSLELLLITPLTDQQLVQAKLLAVMGRYVLLSLVAWAAILTSELLSAASSVCPRCSSCRRLRSTWCARS